jgi:hypothetical protein
MRTPTHRELENWHPRDVAYFVKLHDDLAFELRGRELDHSTSIFEVEGKQRPCVILRKHSNGNARINFRVWCATTSRPKDPKDALPLPRSVVPGLPEDSFLPRQPTEIRWIPEKLARERIGRVEALAFQAISDEADYLVLHGRVSSA